ncbi:MAG: DUF4468 domain-containing protein [Bacteroidales bacterium]|nr:DUF4468 domain-containing protein [Bacteroidales bacterium]
MKALFTSLLTLFILVSSDKLTAQGDYIITTGNDSITGINIVRYPSVMNLEANAYNNYVIASNSDFHIEYAKSGAKKNSSILYNEVERYSVKGVVFRTWHSRLFNYSEGKIVFDKIIDIPGVSKKELWALAKSWLVNTFSLSQDSVNKTLVQDTISGVFSIKQIVPWISTTSPQQTISYSNFIYYNLQLRVKDNKLRITISDIWFHYEKGELSDVVSSKVKGLYKYNLPAEEIVTNWKKGNKLQIHFYQGTMMISYFIEDLIIQKFEKINTPANSDW